MNETPSVIAKVAISVLIIVFVAENMYRIFNGTFTLGNFVFATIRGILLVGIIGWFDKKIYGD